MTHVKPKPADPLNIEAMTNSLVTVEYMGVLADAFGWPRNRPARVVLGDRASAVRQIALCVNEGAIDGVHDPADTVVLATPAGSAFARAGRRAHDVFLGDGAAQEWARAERVVLDASEVLAGGNDGFDEQLVAALGMEAGAPLTSVPLDEVKFVGYVPVEAAERVRAAIFDAGAGMIGDYGECSWSIEGTGTFRGGEESNPTVGTAGQFEQVRELRIESVCRLHLRDRVTRAFVAAHPYEEPAYDVYPLLTPSAVGLGRLTEATLDADALQARLAELFDDAELVVPQRARSESAGVAVTSLPLTEILASVLAEPHVGTVVCGGATAAERALLAERGVVLLVVDRDTVIRRFGERVAARAHAATGLSTRLVAPLQFPGAER